MITLYTLNLYSTAHQLYVSKTGRKKEQELLCKTVNVWSSCYGKREASFTTLQLSNRNIFFRSNEKKKVYFQNILHTHSHDSSRSVLLEFPL